MTVVPLTSNLKKLEQPTHYVLRFAPFLLEKSMAMGEQARAIDKVRILTYLGKLDDRDLYGIEWTAMIHIKAERRRRKRRNERSETGSSHLGKK